MRNLPKARHPRERGEGGLADQNGAIPGADSLYEKSYPCRTRRAGTQVESDLGAVDRKDSAEGSAHPELEARRGTEWIGKLQETQYMVGYGSVSSFRVESSRQLIKLCLRIFCTVACLSTQPSARAAESLPALGQDSREDSTTMRRRSARQPAMPRRLQRCHFERLEPRHVFANTLGFPASIGVGENATVDAVNIVAIPVSTPALANFDEFPMIFAGADASAPALANYQLSGEVLVNSANNLRVQWRVVSGPGSATFGNADSVASTVQFSVPGQYELELEARNGEAVATDRLLVNVTPTNVIAIDQGWLDAQGPGPYYLNQAGKTYQLQVDVKTSGSGFYIANRDIVFDLNGHAILYGSNNAANARGVTLHLSWHNKEVSIPGAVEAFDAVIKNGVIRNEGSGDRAHGIYGYRANGVRIENMRVETRGKDSFAINFVNGGGGKIPGATVVDNLLITHTTSTFNRHDGPANVKTAGRLIAERNVLIGGNSGFVAGSNSVIRHNVIGHNGFATNGYGVWLYRNNDVLIENNLILPTNGRGILFNAGSGHKASGNVILHLEAPNAEFGSNLNPPAVRSRYGTSAIEYSGNTSLGIGGTSLTSASSIYLTSDGTGLSRYENNDATVILTGTAGTNVYAQPLTLEGTGGETTPGLDVIASNRFRSNYAQIRVEGYDGFTRQIEPLRGNSFDWIDGARARQDFAAATMSLFSSLTLSPVLRAAAQQHLHQIDSLVAEHISAEALKSNRATWHTKYVTHDGVGYLDILDSNWGQGVDPKAWTHQYSNNSKGGVKIREGFTRSVMLIHQGAPLANATVTVSTAQGDSYQVATDATGKAKLTFYRFSIEKDEPAGAPFAVIDRNATTIAWQGASALVQHVDVPPQVELSGPTAGAGTHRAADSLAVDPSASEEVVGLVQAMATRQAPEDARQLSALRRGAAQSQLARAPAVEQRALFGLVKDVPTIQTATGQIVIGEFRHESADRRQIADRIFDELGLPETFRRIDSPQSLRIRSVSR